jgi:hypothetical protein
MSNRLVVAAVLVVLAFFLDVRTSLAQDFVQGEILVKLKRGSPETALGVVNGRLGSSIAERL